MEALLKKHAEKIKFAIVGGFNTALDFGLLFLFVFLGLDKIPANFISTGIAFIVSFFLNKSFTFKNKSKNVYKQFAAFLIVTIIGLWVLQPIIIWGFSAATASLNLNEHLSLLIAKLIATVVSLVWNYILYAKFVFKKDEQ